VSARPEDYRARTRYVGAVAGRYVERRASSVKWQREQRAVESLIAAFPRGSIVLDVPLGTGRFLDAYARAGHRACGIDISADMLAQAMAGGAAAGAWLVRGEVERLPLADAAVDYVVCTRFMNWIGPELFARVVGELRRVTRARLVVHVRVAQTLSVTDAIRRLLAPGAGAPPLARRLRRALADGLPARAQRTGYVLHPAAAVHAVFARHGLIVRRLVALDERVVPWRRQCHELRVYVLGRAEAVS
jgi:SAM-dependent methyltransferase